MANIAQREKEKRVRVAVWISPDVDQAVEIRAAVLGIDKREAVERALAKFAAKELATLKAAA